jgi:hypothetical protein
MVQEIG